MTINEKYLLKSYEVSYCITKNKMPFAIGEDFALPAAISRKMVEILGESKYANDIQKISLSKDTVLNKTSDSNKDYLVELVPRIKDSPKLLVQLKETTDITKLAQLLVFVGYIYKDSRRKKYYVFVLWETILQGKT